MPRLSIIVPHRKDHQLEETILSVLENRPRDCEIIVVHDGSYRDPYRLVDEVVYVQEEPKATVVELLNAGLMAACSPIVCVLLDGVVVSSNWSESALKRMTQSDVAAIAPQLQVDRRTVCGIANDSIRNTAKLRSGRVDSKSTDIAAPTLAAGFYRRKQLLAMGGWNDEISCASTDVELALMMDDLGLGCECEPQTVFQVHGDAIPVRTSPTGIGELAGIAAAHGTASPSLGAKLTSLLSSLLTGTLANTLAWTSGLSNQTVIREVAERLEYARKQLGNGQESISIKIPSAIPAAQHRRAA